MSHSLILLPTCDRLIVPRIISDAGPQPSNASSSSSRFDSKPQRAEMLRKDPVISSPGWSASLPN